MSTELAPIYVLDLDEDFLSHLAIPESWMVIKAESVDPELIEDEYVVKVFNWQRDHDRQHGAPATPTVLSEEFDIDFSVPVTSIGDCIERLRARYIKTTGKETLAEIVKTYKEDPLTLPALLSKAGRELTYMATKKGEVFGSGDYDRAMYLYDKKFNLGPGASLGFQEPNEHFFGQRGLTYVIAPPKTYKSWYMLIALADNVMEGKMTTLFSLELPGEETDMRLRCFLADIPFWHYLKNQFTHDDRKKIAEVSEYIDSMGIYKIHKPAEGQRSIDQLVEIARNEGSEVVLIDQLQYVEVEGRSLGELNNTGAYWGVLNRARNLSDDGPIMIAHQFNRQAMFSEKMPEIQYAKGSSAIEETATLALGLWANKDMRRSGLVKLGTLIARNYMYKEWEMEVNLGRGCNFSIRREVEDEE